MNRSCCAGAGVLDCAARSGFASPYHLAYVYTGLGEHDRAIDLLEHAVASRTGAPAIAGDKGGVT